MTHALKVLPCRAATLLILRSSSGEKLRMLRLVISGMIRVYHGRQLTVNRARVMSFELEPDYRDYANEPFEWMMAQVTISPMTPVFLDYSAAIHEASHAVLNEHYGYKVNVVELHGVRGITAAERATNPEHTIIIAHAGYIGAIQMVNKYYAFGTANEDNLEIDQIYKREKYTPKQVRDLYAVSAQLVERYWTLIQNVADALATKKSLSGDQVRSIIRGT